MLERKSHVPELFLWHVFESLLAAVHYCHTGPTDQHPGTWDPIYHRDIILGNVLLISHDSPDTPYSTVKLADFGCAMSRYEVEENHFKVEDLPEACESALAPEGAVASAAADVWQVGLTVLRLLAATQLNCEEIKLDMKQLVEYFDKYSDSHMWDLRHLLGMCVSKDPANRPTAEQLLHEVRKRRSELMCLGKLKFEALRL
ncbi:kinase-like domain-containing protein [Phaeosphaeria sp. MPI-PUGE-AT-0046c]|nr:kinase-like domain-containing protein [Phaeosphaeria sp. MPI-PUGE-AT-0046c]